MLKIIGNDINNNGDLCLLCGDFLEAISFMGHDILLKKECEMYTSTIETLITVLNNSIINSVRIKTLNTLLVKSLVY